MNRVLYLIDGVSVPRKTFERAKLWGEHAAAIFRVEVIKAGGAR